MNKAANNTETTATVTVKALECTEDKRVFPESPLQKLAKEAADEEAKRLSAHISEVKHTLESDKSEVEKLADKLNIPEEEIKDALNKREISIQTAISLSDELNIPMQLFNINQESIKKEDAAAMERYKTEKVYTEKDKTEIIAKVLQKCIMVVLENKEMESEDAKLYLIDRIASLAQDNI